MRAQISSARASYLLERDILAAEHRRRAVKNKNALPPEVVPAGCK